MIVRLSVVWNRTAINTDWRFYMTFAVVIFRLRVSYFPFVDGDDEMIGQ